MSARFDSCLAFVLQAEGGFVRNPNDPGGATNLGITLGTLSQWLGEQATVDSVRALTPETVAPIYDKLYWAPIHGDSLPVGVDLMCFDAAVNMGDSTSIRFLQDAVHVAVDGVCGPATLAAVKAADADALISSISSARMAYYRSRPTFPVFGNGWLARLAKTTAQALKDAAA